jgi:hypothetical protein
MAQPTAVEWFWIHLEDNISKKYFDLFQQAKQMEKEQIMNAYRFPNTLVDMSSEEYYTQTYNQNL